MTATGHMRGHCVYYDGAWLYADTGQQADAEDRPCVACGRPAQPCSLDGQSHDPCLGHVAGVTSACCGHGVEPGYTA